jgi:hypothetical protein
MNEISIERTFHTKRRRNGAKALVEGVADEQDIPAGRVPRLARLMALAIRFDRLLATGELTDFADIARLGHITRARASQIMNLTLLAPDLQEEILFMPEVTAGRDLVKEWQVRPIAATADWGKQRRMWAELANC